MSHHHHHGGVIGARGSTPAHGGRVRPYAPDYRPPTPEERAYHEFIARHSNGVSAPELKPLDFDARTANDLRPMTFDGMVGQSRLKSLLGRIVENAVVKGITLDHILLVGSAGTGKTTFAQVIAHEMGRRVYMLKAPLEYTRFAQLADTAQDGDVIVVDEIHQQVSGDRRGVSQAADPETFYSVLEDHRLVTPTGVVPFPDVTFIGCTTDAGLLPEPFLARFPLQPALDRYTVDEMAELAKRNAAALNMQIVPDAALRLAAACRRTPRVLNRYVRNARSLDAMTISPQVATEVVSDLNSTTEDGLDRDMQNMLAFLLTQRREKANGEVRYQAGLNTIATALGKSRDSKSVALYVEPYLIEQGWVAVSHGGRVLSDTGIKRAREL